MYVADALSNTFTLASAEVKGIGWCLVKVHTYEIDQIKLHLFQPHQADQMLDPQMGFLPFPTI